jgi:hypothetical protein
VTTGRIAVVLIVVTALLGGVLLFWLQVWGYYRAVPPDTPLTVTVGGVAQPLAMTGFQGIDAGSSPIRFRACLQAEVPSGADPYPGAVPLMAPFWFGCFDAGAIGAALAAGEARAVLSARDIHWGVDRVMAVYPDGRAFAWHQINACGREVFDGRSAPAGCPPRPTRGP